VDRLEVALSIHAGRNHAVALESAVVGSQLRSRQQRSSRLHGEVLVGTGTRGKVVEGGSARAT
jgi:hypothetical protein